MVEGRRRIEPDQSELWHLWVVKADRRARAVLIETNLVYVRRVVGKMVRTLPPHVDHDDIESYGKIGLIRAVDHYDPDEGTPFSSYAVASIRGLILDELRVIDWAPRSLRKRSRDVERARETLQARHGRLVSEGEIGDEIGQTGAWVRQVIAEVAHSTFKSLHEGAPQDGEGELLGEVPDSRPEPEESAMLAATMLLVSTWMAGLPEESQAVLGLYYYWDMTFSQIAQTTGMPTGRVSGLHNELILELGALVRSALGSEPDSAARGA